MNLAIVRANGGFSQWSLSIKGIPTMHRWDGEDV